MDASRLAFCILSVMSLHHNIAVHPVVVSCTHEYAESSITLFGQLSSGVFQKDMLKLNNSLILVVLI